MTEYKNPYENVVAYPIVINDGNKLKAYEMLYKHDERTLTEEEFKKVLQIFYPDSNILIICDDVGCIGKARNIKKVKIINNGILKHLEYETDLNKFLNEKLFINLNKVL